MSARTFGEAGARDAVPSRPAPAPDAMPRSSLTIAAPDDALESEAARVSQRLLHGGPLPGPLSARGGESSAGEAPPIVHEVLRAPGHPLEPGARARFESALGRDFSGVRVHTDARAAQSARAVDAAAYTVGQDLVFAAGRFEPHSAAGRGLLAHELTHVAQSPGAGAGHHRLHRQPQGQGAPAAQPAPTEQQLQQQYEHDCAGVRVLERLERVERTPQERVHQLERRLRRLPEVFKALQQAKASSPKDEVEFYKAQVWPEFGEGYVMRDLQDELARARCELAKARWELSVFERTGRIPGRLLKPHSGTTP